MSGLALASRWMTTAVHDMACADLHVPMCRMPSYFHPLLVELRKEWYKPHLHTGTAVSTEAKAAAAVCCFVGCKARSGKGAVRATACQQSSAWGAITYDSSSYPAA